LLQSTPPRVQAPQTNIIITPAPAPPAPTAPDSVFGSVSNGVTQLDGVDAVNDIVHIYFVGGIFQIQKFSLYTTDQLCKTTKPHLY
jgi:hypothetical protein